MDRVNPRQGDGTRPGGVWGAFKSWHRDWPGPSCLFGGTRRGTAKLLVVSHSFLIALCDPLKTASVSVLSSMSYEAPLPKGQSG